MYHFRHKYWRNLRQRDVCFKLVNNNSVYFNQNNLWPIAHIHKIQTMVPLANTKYPRQEENSFICLFLVCFLIYFC